MKQQIQTVVFDHKMLPDELDESDFLNFTYLKLAFPAAIKYLNNNWQTILPYNSQTKLRELRESNNDGDVHTITLMKGIRLAFTNRLIDIIKEVIEPTLIKLDVGSES